MPATRPPARRWTLALTLAGAVGGFTPAATPGPGGSAAPDRNGLGPMASSPNSTSLLVDYYEALLRDGDLDGFRRDVSARYNEATLARLLGAADPQARRAAVLGLGLFGGFAASNAAVAGAMKDKDPLVRTLAHDALWAIWFRADSPEHNEALAKVRKLIAASQGADAPDRADRLLAEALDRATRLIAEAPTFAEAYNQRAIAQFIRGDLAASVADCREVLKLNPYHFGALSGMGRCLLRLDKRAEAAVVFRQASAIQPFDDGLRDLIADLEADR